MRSFLLLPFLLISFFLRAQAVNISISGIRNTEGSIRVQIFNSSQSFDDNKPLFTKTCSKAGVTGGRLRTELSGLKPGVYGIAILDDENSNQKMDYGLLLPKEGFGFSDYYHSSMSRPLFTQFDFILGTESKTVEIRVRYL